MTLTAGMGCAAIPTELPSVLMTPRVAGWTDRMLDARARVVAENIRLNLVAS
jgi:phosphoglycerate dehydrogenase-like enzyme